MNVSFAAYQKRPIRFLDVWLYGNWRLKVYGIAYQRPTPRPELVQAAMTVAKERLTIMDDGNHYFVGFIGVHEGRSSNFVFVDWWADENELHHHVYVSPTDQPSQFTYVTPTGLAACVWDLRVIGFERAAWLQTVLERPGGPDFEEYLNQRLNEDV